MSNKREREKRREQRVQEETKVDSGERRTRLLQFGAGAVFLAIVAVAILIVVNGNSDSGGDAQNLKDVSTVDKLFTGIPQEELVLGDPKAKVELIEYGDLQCPVCKAYSEEFLPQIIEGQVKEGKAKSSSATSRSSARNRPRPAPRRWRPAPRVAAGSTSSSSIATRARRTRATPTTNSSPPSPKAPASKNIAKWETDRKGTKYTDQVTATTEEAQRLGFTGTPSFAIKGPSTNGLELLGTPSAPSEVEEEIEKAS